jgi:hypothetical protein
MSAPRALKGRAARKPTEHRALKMFRMKTTHSAQLKAFFDLLFQNVTTACLTIDAAGIRSENQTTYNLVIAADMPASAFEEYAYTYAQPIHVGFGSHVNQLLKDAKKKTTTIMSVVSAGEHRYELRVEIVSEARVQTVTSTIECVQNVATTAFPTYYSPPVSITSTHFTGLCKSLKCVVNVVKTSGSQAQDGQPTNGHLTFSFDVADICRNTVAFDTPAGGPPQLVHKRLTSEQFLRIAKLYRFATDTIEMYVEADRPMMVIARAPIGSICILINDANDAEQALRDAGV